jgi:hypothetical protein
VTQSNDIYEKRKRKLIAREINTSPLGEINKYCRKFRASH